MYGRNVINFNPHQLINQLWGDYENARGNMSYLDLLQAFVGLLKYNFPKINEQTSSSEETDVYEDN